MNIFNFKTIKKTWLFLKLLSLILLFYSASSFSQDSSIEYKIKAAYLYNFTKFIVWPENQYKTFNLCILGDDPFGLLINPIESRKVNNKFIKVHRLHSISDVGYCQMVYFGEQGKQWAATQSYLPGVLTISSQQNALSVGESIIFTQAGGMIAFVFKEGKIKLQINLNAVRQSHLEISAQLLEVAEIVNGDSND